ncbi:HcpA family protein [Nitrospira sp. KM1]|uniref:tetratricopeptide repeat protein n=1 Tax=Nitrospira sp. KM1 TaxID=1936990 RepID=UPI0013A72E6A|nr:SEL1-like repeat protein [Nitrospira sp. KM1]BCA53790.1 HcpA family protein [Nitrospira sp. KM1]
MRTLRLCTAILAMIPCAVYADLNGDFAACRRNILQIGSDPKSPAEQYCLGLSYAFALNHPKNRSTAASWFRKAAEQNYAPAQAILGYLYERGDGVRTDPVEAAKWYRKAAEQGHDDGLFNMGRAYEHGIGLTKDLGQARTYYSKAAAAGSRDAQQALAGLGQATEPLTPDQDKINAGLRLYKAKDFAGAAKIFQKLAEQGHPRAQYRMAYQYERGEGVRKNCDDAARWYRKSADQGYAEAQNYLGMMYEDGICVKEDWAEAVRWVRKSADQGNPDGIFLLGRVYQFGMTVPQSRQEAIRWFDKAGDKGHDQANYWSNQLKGRNTYIGFRNDAERDAVVGLKLRMVTLNIEPVGRTFRNSSERMAYLMQAGKQADDEEAMLQWEWKNREYKACRDAGGSGCIAPDPPR